MSSANNDTAIWPPPQRRSDVVLGPWHPSLLPDGFAEFMRHLGQGGSLFLDDARTEAEDGLSVEENDSEEEEDDDAFELYVSLVEYGAPLDEDATTTDTSMIHHRNNKPPLPIVLDQIEGSPYFDEIPATTAEASFSMRGSLSHFHYTASTTTEVDDPFAQLLHVFARPDRFPIHPRIPYNDPGTTRRPIDDDDDDSVATADSMPPLLDPNERNGTTSSDDEDTYADLPPLVDAQNNVVVEDDDASISSASDLPALIRRDMLEDSPSEESAEPNVRSRPNDSPPPMIPRFLQDGAAAGGGGIPALGRRFADGDEEDASFDDDNDDDSTASSMPGLLQRREGYESDTTTYSDPELPPLVERPYPSSSSEDDVWQRMRRRHRRSESSSSDDGRDEVVWEEEEEPRRSVVVSDTVLNQLLQMGVVAATTQPAGSFATDAPMGAVDATPPEVTPPQPQQLDHVSNALVWTETLRAMARTEQETNDDDDELMYL